MKFATVHTADRARLVVQTPAGNVVDVGVLIDDPAVDMGALIEHADRLLPRIRDALSTCTDIAGVAADSVQWQAPVPRPSKIVGVALNNSVFDFLARRPMPAPAFFLTPPSALIGHGQAIEIGPDYGLTHPEPELAAVIGRRVRNAAPDEALDAVFGYTAINDITSPGLKSADSVELVMPEQMPIDEPWRARHGDADRSVYLTYHARSKGCDTFAPMGPWLVTADDIADPNDLGVRGYLDGELVLEDSTSKLTHSVQRVLSHLSHSMTLFPGDVVHFGTAANPAMPDRYPTLRAIDISRLGSSVSVEIDGIGRLDNPVDRRRPSTDACIQGAAATIAS